MTSCKFLWPVVLVAAMFLNLFPGTASAKYRPFKCPAANASATVDIAFTGDAPLTDVGFQIAGLIDVRVPREADAVKCLFKSWNDQRRERYNKSLISLAKRLLWENSDSLYSHETIFGKADDDSDDGLDVAKLREALVASPSRAEWMGTARWHTPHNRANVPCRFGGKCGKAKAKADPAPAPASARAPAPCPPPAPAPASGQAPAPAQAPGPANGQAPAPAQAPPQSGTVA